MAERKFTDAEVIAAGEQLRQVGARSMAGRYGLPSAEAAPKRSSASGSDTTLGGTGWAIPTRPLPEEAHGDYRNRSRQADQGNAGRTGRCP